MSAEAHQVTAGIPRELRDTIVARAPHAELVDLEDRTDLIGLDFLVPIPYAQAELIALLPSADRLVVIQTLSAGVDGLIDSVAGEVTLCSARGARDHAVAEWVLGALLGSSARLLEKSGARRWERDVHVRDLAGSTVLIVGMGSIGGQVARMLDAFGARAVGVVSRARDGVHGIDELDELLPSADAVVLLTPLAEATRGLIDAGRLALMRDGALLVNAARGPVVDTDALVAETTSGRVRAVLDVTDPEPLPDGHPLWDARGVLCITPHIGGDSRLANRRAAELAGDQLARFCAGEPLLNVVRQGTRLGRA